MKKSALIVLAILALNAASAQNKVISFSNDSIYIESELVGVVQIINERNTAVFVKRQDMLIVREKRISFPFIERYSYTKYAFNEQLSIDKKEQKIYNSKGKEIGLFNLDINKNNGQNIINVGVGYIEYELPYIKLVMENNGIPPAYQSSNYKFNLYYTLQDYQFKEEELRKQQEKAAEKLRIERFYAMVKERLSGELSQVEGFYKSIDFGEGEEYDIAVLQSDENPRELNCLVLASTDEINVPIGSILFTLTKTAQENIFFTKYVLQDGRTFTNKIATLESVILTMSEKSFIKMFPMDGVKQEFSEVNPSLDWESSGSGVLINKDGYIVTNHHVISDAGRIRVSFQNDSIEYFATVISENEITDVAIIKIVDTRFDSNISPINWSKEFNLGQKVFTLGYPISDKMSQNVKVVDGIVSGENGRGGDPAFFQTTLPVWYGNSGGPCFNSKGEILGLATQILWDRGEKVDNVAYITKTENILNLGSEIIEQVNETGNEKTLEELVQDLIPYSVFIKINY